MQTEMRMAHSCSSHFSEQISYRTLVSPSYGLKAMNFTSFKPFSGIPGKKDKRETFLTEGKQPRSLMRGAATLTGCRLGGCTGASVHGR
jgi:hypothetical protein